MTVVTIHGIAAGGAGVGHLPDGRAVFVHRTAPGDRVEVEITASRKRWARGRLLRVLEPGPGRRTPPCAHASRCGGCTLQHLEDALQGEARVTLVMEALRRIGGLGALPEPEFHAPGPALQYRNRASFTLRRLGTRPGGVPPVVAGFHALERPGHVVDVGEERGGPCLLLEPELSLLWERLRRGWGRDARNLPSGETLRLTLRVLADGSGLLLVEGGHAPGRPELLLDAVPGLEALWWAPEGGSPRGAAPRLLAGRDDLEEVWYGESLPVRPGAFLQVNREAGRHLHDLALEALAPEPGDRVVDAYAGFGVYGRAAARAGAVAVGIERDAGAVAMGRSRPVPGFELREGPVEALLPQALPARRVLLNPPRGGVAEGVMEALAASNPPPVRVVYVSCDPATLARDLARLGDAFRVTRLQVVDLFPQTSHVETVATLEPLARAPGSSAPGGAAISGTGTRPPPGTGPHDSSDPPPGSPGEGGR